MRVLWVCNVPPHKARSIDGYSGGGWISGAMDSVLKYKDIQLLIAYPVLGRKEITEDVVEGVTFYEMPQEKALSIVPIGRKRISRKIKNQIQKLVIDISPDILHVFGTESEYSRYIIESYNRPENTVIHIQGLVSYIAKHCTYGFPFVVKHLFVISSALRGTLYSRAKFYERAGKKEAKLIRSSKFVMGRTEWDEACTKSINPSINYVHCNETLRSSFYDKSAEWTYDHCDKCTIYFSQSSSQVKGLHLVLPILPELIRRYPKTHLYIGGNSPIGAVTMKGNMKRSPLGWYLLYQLHKYHLEKYVTFLGVQSEVQVIENLKRANVFLSASLIENSPNSIGEAMVVGTPVVSSDVGGVKDFIKHGENGFIFPLDEPYMMTYYIGKLFEDVELANSFSQLGRITSSLKYSAQENGEALWNLYRKMSSELSTRDSSFGEHDE